MKRVVTVLLGTIFVLVGTRPGFSGEAKATKEELAAIKADIQELKDGQKAIQKDLQEIKGLLAAKQPPPEFKETVVSIKDDPFRGEKEAGLVLIEFFDYQ
jgi:hypothetical protein